MRKGRNGMASNENRDTALETMYAENKNLRAENLRLSQALASVAEELEELRAKYENLVGGIEKMIEAETQNRGKKK